MCILVRVASERAQFLHKGICAHTGRASSGLGVPSLPGGTNGLD